MQLGQLVLVTFKRLEGLLRIWMWKIYLEKREQLEGFRGEGKSFDEILYLNMD